MCTVYEQYGLYEQFVRAPKSARFSLFVSFHVLFKHILLQNRENLVYEWAGVILRPGPLVPMLPNGRQGQGAVVRRIALDGAETTWPGLLLLPGFPTENALSLADRGHNMRLRPKISNSFLNVHILFTISS